MKGDPSKTRFLEEFQAELNEAQVLCQKLSKHLYLEEQMIEQHQRAADRKIRIAATEAAARMKPSPAEQILESIPGQAELSTVASEDGFLLDEQDGRSNPAWVRRSGRAKEIIQAWDESTIPSWVRH